MADFKTHITVSTACGIAYGGVAYAQFGVPAPSCVLAGALCSVSGMLPDLDSDSGVPLRESLSFASACVPMLLLERFRHLGWSPETIALAGAGVYVAVRFGLGWMLKKYTVHRGMFHSVPAALIAGAVAFLLCSNGSFQLRAYKACAVMLGFMSHLILDEIWSVKVSGGRIGLKSSSGTAVKFFSDSMWANISTYGKLAILGVLVFNDPIWLDVSPQAARLHELAGVATREVESQTNGKLPMSLPSILSPRPTTTAGAAAPPTPTQPQSGGSSMVAQAGAGTNPFTVPPSQTPPGPTVPASYAPGTPVYGTSYTVPQPGYAPPQTYAPPGYIPPPAYAPPPTYPQGYYPNPPRAVILPGR